MVSLHTLLSYEILGLSGYEIIFAGTILIISIILGLIFKKIIFGKLKTSLEKREKGKKLSQLLEKVDSSLPNSLFLLLGLYFSISSLPLPVTLQNYLRFLAYLFVSYYLLRFSFNLIDLIISINEGKFIKGGTNILNLIRLATRTAIIVIIGLWLLSNLGIDTTAFIASLGVFALAIAFALQNVISDIFAALVIYTDQPFEIGDHIQVSGEIGQVEAIGIRSTKIRALTGNLIIISNQELIKSRISNFKKMERRRVLVTVGVHKETSIDLLRTIPEKIANLFPAIERTSFDRCHLSSINTSSYDYELIFFIQSRSYSEYQAILAQVNYGIITLFEEMGVQIPYPTEVHVVRKEV